jgi:hypothetical protein
VRQGFLEIEIFFGVPSVSYGVMGCRNKFVVVRMSECVGMRQTGEGRCGERRREARECAFSKNAH